MSSQPRCHDCAAGRSVESEEPIGWGKVLVHGTLADGTTFSSLRELDAPSSGEAMERCSTCGREVVMGSKRRRTAGPAVTYSTRDSASETPPPPSPSEQRTSKSASELLTTAEAAAVASVKPATIRAWIEDGHLSRVGTLRELRVKRDELDALLAAGPMKRRMARKSKVAPEEAARLRAEERDRRGSAGSQKRSRRRSQLTLIPGGDRGEG